MKLKELYNKMDKIERYVDDIYDLNIIYNGCHIGHRMSTRRCLNWYELWCVMSNAVDIVSEMCNGVEIRVAQDVDYKSDVYLILMEK